MKNINICRLGRKTRSSKNGDSWAEEDMKREERMARPRSAYAVVFTVALRGARRRCGAGYAHSAARWLRWLAGV
jgi:hypothetical protein